MSLNPAKSLTNYEEIDRFVDVVFPGETNHHGTLFGGASLSILDKFAFVIASRKLRRTVVTASLREVNFCAPVAVGQIVEITGQVIRQGKRSLTLRAELISEDMLTGVRAPCLSGELVMVGQEMDAVADEDIARIPPALPDQIRMVEIVFPGQTNHRGVLHGGFALDWLSKGALAAAGRAVRQSVVLASSKTLDFVAPAYVGDIVETRASVVAIGRTSLTIAAEMWAESPLHGNPRLCTKCQFVFVAIDEQGFPCPIEKRTL